MSDPISPTPFNTLLGSVRLVESNYLAGMKHPVLQGNTLYVSPAMMELIRKEEGDDLRKLLTAMKAIEMPAFNLDFYSYMPMFAEK